jgi:hypothetical protein
MTVKTFLLACFLHILLFIGLAIPEIARADFDNTIAYAEAGEKDKEEWDWYRYGMSKRPKLQPTVCEPNRGGYEAYMLGINNQP